MDKMVANWILVLKLFFLLVPFGSPQVYIAPLSNYRIEEKMVYENVAPILLRYTIPENDPSHLMVLDLTNCSGSTQFSYCPLYYHFQLIRDVLRPLITKESLNSNLPATDPFFINNCEQLGKHFTSEHINEQQLNTYKSLLNNCLFDTIVEKRDDSFAPSDFPALYRQGHQRSLAIYPPTHTHLEASLAVETGLLTTAGFLHFLAESLLWKEAISTCRIQKIPRTLVKEVRLLSAVIELEQKILVEGYSLVLPKDDLGAYYNLPIADCVFVESPSGNLQELVLRILARDTNWKPYAIQSIPFAHSYQGEKYLCHHLPNEQELKILYNGRTSSQLLIEKCDENNFCHISASTRPVRKSCSQKILSSVDNLDIIGYCPLVCEPFETFNFPVISKGGHDVFYVAGPTDESSQVTVACDGDIDRKYFLPAEGALKITLPCHCDLLAEGLAYKPSPANCQQLPIPNEIVQPFHFQRNQNLRFTNHF